MRKKFNLCVCVVARGGRDRSTRTLDLQYCMLSRISVHEVRSERSAEPPAKRRIPRGARPYSLRRSISAGHDFSIHYRAASSGPQQEGWQKWQVEKKETSLKV